MFHCNKARARKADFPRFLTIIMASSKGQWFFTKEQIMNSPSRRYGMDYDKEMSHRQQAANLIQDMGQTLQVNQLCINTAIVYMHRFYMFHSFTQFHRNSIAASAIFLAAKVEEQPRKLDHVVKVAHKLTNREQPSLEPKSEVYNDAANKLVMHENILLQTLGFDAVIDHPHTHVVKCCQYVRASKDLAQTSYFMATNSLHLTTMCLQYSPTVVACVCIHIVSKWTNIQIPPSSEGRNWWYYIDKSVTLERLEALTAEFLEIFNKCPARLKKRIQSGTQGVAGSSFPGSQLPLSVHPSAGVKVPTHKPHVPVEEHGASTLVHRERSGQVASSHRQSLPKPQSQSQPVPALQRQMNGTKPTPQLVKHPTQAPVPPHTRPHPVQPLAVGHTPVASGEVKPQPPLPRMKTYSNIPPNQPPPPRNETAQTILQDLTQTLKRPEMVAKPEPKPQVRPDPSVRLQPQPQIINRPEHLKRDGQTLPLRPDHPFQALRAELRAESQRHQSSHTKVELSQKVEISATKHIHSESKRVTAVRTEVPPAPPKEVPAPPPPLPKTKPPEPPKPPSLLGTANQNMPPLNQAQFTPGILGDFPVSMEQEVMDTNWDMDFGDLSPPFSALLGEKAQLKNHLPKAMPSLFSPEDDRRSEPPQSVQVEKTAEESKKREESSITKTSENITVNVAKEIKEVTNKEVKKDKPTYSTIDTKQHENLFSTLMVSPATSIFGIPQVKSPEKPKEMKAERMTPPLPPPPPKAPPIPKIEPLIQDPIIEAIKEDLKSVTIANSLPSAIDIKESKKEAKSEDIDKHHKKKKKKEHKKHKNKETDESKKERKKHKKEKDRQKEKTEESPKKKAKVEDLPVPSEKPIIPKLKIKAPKPPSPVSASSLKSAEVIPASEGLKIKIKMPKPPSDRKRDRTPSVSEGSSKSRKLENGEHERKKEKKEKHKSHKKDSSREKSRES
ncbi:hypothetical protein QYM36_009360 [Artemia franciscana]|nr:hypothetical protein QYM36_009360 [Artemia franciscana]KAK2713462.1 hypothetical protein QYM36_009360 [Artemia franciscana]